MENMKLKMQDLDGNVIEEKELKLGDSDVLVMTFDNEQIDLEFAHHFFETVNEGLENNSRMIAVPSSVVFSVIKRA